MKLATTTLLAPLKKAEVKELTNQVAETLDIDRKPKKGFTSAQLWSIHKQKRIRGMRAPII